MAKEVNAVQTQHDSSCYMQQDTHIMSLHANKRSMLNKVIFYRKKFHKARTFEHPGKPPFKAIIENDSKMRDWFLQ